MWTYFWPCGAVISHLCCSGTDTHRLASCTMAYASMSPYPKLCETFLPTPLTSQSEAMRFSGLAVLITMCCMSLQLRFGLASSARAHIPAAKGAEALVPVWLLVQLWCKSVVTTCRSPTAPLLYVDARVELQASLYQGTWPCSVALEMDKLYIELVYPSALQLSWSRPPFPEAQTKIDPLPFRP